MKEKNRIAKDSPASHYPARWKQTAMLAAGVAVIQACLTISGRGIEGFILWVVILFLAYWLLFTFLIWLWQRRSRR